MAPQRTAPLVATPLHRAATGQPAATAATTANVPLVTPPRLVELGEVARLGEGGAELPAASAASASPAASIAAAASTSAAAAAAATHCRATER